MTRDQELARSGSACPGIPAQLYNYPCGTEHPATIVCREETSYCVREKVILLGAHKDPAPGLLGVPKASLDQAPCVLLVHGLGGNKGDWWCEEGDLGQLACALLRSGIAVFTLDMKSHGERAPDTDEGPAWDSGGGDAYVDLVVDSTIDHRLALDYLITRPDLDSHRLGVLGYSLGGVVAFALAGVDSRVRVATTCSTWPITSYYTSRIGWPEQSLVQLAAVAPQTYAPLIRHAAFLMINGKRDPWGTLPEIRDLFKHVASETKSLVLTDSTHEFSARHIPRIVGWFRRHLQST